MKTSEVKTSDFATWVGKQTKYTKEQTEAVMQDGTNLTELVGKKITLQEAKTSGIKGEEFQDLVCWYMDDHELDSITFA